MTKTDLEKAKSYAYNLLRFQPRSEKELNFRLNKKGFSSAISSKVISLLKEKGLLDDLKFAEAWVDSRLRSNPKGDIVLRQELIKKGIASEIVERVLSTKKEDEENLVRHLAEERLKVLRGLPKLKAKKRLCDYLARRGFEYDIINDVLSKVLSRHYEEFRNKK